MGDGYVKNGAAWVVPVLADRARSEFALSMREVGSTYTHSRGGREIEEEERPPTKVALLLS